MKKNPNQNNQLEITDLIGDAVQNAIARREQNLTAEETEQIKGGLTTLPLPKGGVTILGGPFFPPCTVGLITAGPIKQMKF